MSELKPCPFCGGEAWMRISDAPQVLRVECRRCHVATTSFVADGIGEKEAAAAWNTRTDYHGYEQAAIEAWENIKAWNTRHVDGQTSDGYHTFDELYYHRTALFACLVATQPRQMAFKSWKHADGTMYEGMFIAGIYTSRGWCTYHCEAKWWPLFDCSEREHAPGWDGHTPSDAIHRLMHDLLPEQEVSGEVDGC